MKTKDKGRYRINRKVISGALITGLSYLVVGFLWATRLQVWGDEAFSIQIIQLDFAKINQVTAADVHPPLYYYLLKIWADIFGNGELILRLFGLILVAISVSVMVLIAYRYFSAKVAWITSIIMITSPFAMRLGLEIRMYCLAFLITSLLFWFYLDYRSGNQTRINLLAVAILAALSIYTHYYAIFLLIGLAIVEYWDYARGFNLRKFWGFVRNSWFFRVGILTIIFYLPWINVFIGRLIGFNGGFWVPKPSLFSIFYLPVLFLTNIEEYLMFGWPALAIGFVIFCLIGFNYRKIWKFFVSTQKKSNSDNINYNWLLLTRIGLVVTVVMLGISLVFKTSVFYGRYLSISVFFTFVFTIAGLIGALLLDRSRRLAVLATGILLLIGVVYSFVYGNTRLLKEQQVTVYQDKSAIECSIDNKNGKDNIYLIDDDSNYLIYDYYLRDILDQDSQFYLIGDKEKPDINGSAWKRVINERGAFNYLSKGEIVRSIDFYNNNIWYVSWNWPRFEDPGAKDSLYRDYRVEQVCQPDARLLTDYDAARAYRLVPK